MYNHRKCTNFRASDTITFYQKETQTVYAISALSLVNKKKSQRAEKKKRSSDEASEKPSMTSAFLCQVNIIPTRRDNKHIRIKRKRRRRKVFFSFGVTTCVYTCPSGARTTTILYLYTKERHFYEREARDSRRHDKSRNWGRCERPGPLIFIYLAPYRRAL